MDVVESHHRACPERTHYIKEEGFSSAALCAGLLNADVNLISEISFVPDGFKEWNFSVFLAALKLNFEREKRPSNGNKRFVKRKKSPIYGRRNIDKAN